MTVLSENGRLSSAPRVFADFGSLMAAYRGELEVVVTSAEPLDSKAMQRLDKALKSSKEAEGKTIKITNRVRQLLQGHECRWQIWPFAGLGPGQQLTPSRSTPLFSAVSSLTSETRPVCPSLTSMC